MKPGVLVVIPRIIYPAVSGGELRVYSLLRRLSGRYRFSLLTFIEPRARAQSLAAAMSLEKSLVERVHCVERSPSPRLVEGTALPSDFYRSRELARGLRAILARGGTDLVQIEFAEMAQYARDAGGRVPVVLTEHDTSVLSRDRSYLRKALGARTLLRQRAYHRRALSRCDRVVVMSEADRERMAELVDARRLCVVPTGVDLEQFPVAPWAGRRGRTIVFVGHYLHYPNQDAAVRLRREILPRVARRAPGARLLLVGSGVTGAVRALAGPSVRVTGPVESVHPFLAGAKVFAAPMRLGHGIKGKLLEAFAAGVPVVASTQACEGIPQAKHGEHLLQADDPERFAGHVARLLVDPALGRSLARAARALVERHFRWEQSAARLDRLYKDLLDARA